MMDIIVTSQNTGAKKRFYKFSEREMERGRERRRRRKRMGKEKKKSISLWTSQQLPWRLEDNGEMASNDSQSRILYPIKLSNKWEDGI